MRGLFTKEGLMKLFDDLPNDIKAYRDGSKCFCLETCCGEYKIVLVENCQKREIGLKTMNKDMDGFWLFDQIFPIKAEKQAVEAFHKVCKLISDKQVSQDGQ